MIDVRYCRWCGKEVEDKAEPGMGGPRPLRWVHYPGGYSICFPQQSGSPRAEPEERVAPEVTEDPKCALDCRWPACLSEADQQLLVEQVGASMRGEETVLLPDPRSGCGCVDRGAGLEWS